MHMADSLVSATVGTTMAAVSSGAALYSIQKLKSTDLNSNKIPMMGVMGAFIFAAQMINFTIPGTGSSGHIGGGILLAAILGPFPAFLTIVSVLIIQALFFADGGLLALGCNIFNMGVLTCFVAYPLIYKPFLKKSITTRKLTLASILAVVFGLQLGAFSVVLETTVSGVTLLPFGAFVLLMQPIHLAIGLVEGIITGAVLCFVYQTRKEVITGALSGSGTSSPMKKTIITFAVAAVIIGGGLSYFASQKPDGLEWATQNLIGNEEPTIDSKAHTGSKDIQEKTAILPDYTFRGEAKENTLGTGLSGVAGGIFTLTLTIASGLIIMKLKKQKNIR